MIVQTWQMKKQATINDITRNQKFAIKHLGRAMVEWTNQLEKNESKKTSVHKGGQRNKTQTGTIQTAEG